MTGTPYPASTTSPANAPSVWAKRLAGYQWERQGVGRSAATVFRLTAAGQPELYVKAEPAGLFCGLMGEASRLRWLTARGLPCPQVLGLEAESGWHWLLMTGLPGGDLSQRRDLLPSETIELVVGALRRLHAQPIKGCPFDQRLSRWLAAAQARLATGRVDARNFADENLGRSPEELFELLLESRPQETDLVLTHGDPSLPNLLVERRNFVGFIDCGRLGIADRYQDLALAGWSIGYNLGVDWVEPFFAAYGLDKPDRPKLAFYRMLDEFF